MSIRYTIQNYCRDYRRLYNIYKYITLDRNMGKIPEVEYFLNRSFPMWPWTFYTDRDSRAFSYASSSDLSYQNIFHKLCKREDEVQCEFSCASSILRSW